MAEQRTNTIKARKTETRIKYAYIKTDANGAKTCATGEEVFPEKISAKKVKKLFEQKHLTADVISINYIEKVYELPRETFFEIAQEIK